MANSSAGIILQALADSKYATKRPPECVAAADAIGARSLSSASDPPPCPSPPLPAPQSLPEGS